MLPDARYQRCTVHFMRNVLSRVSRKHAAWAGRRAQGRVRHGIPRRRVEEGGGCGRADGIRGLKAAASCLREGIGESTTSCSTTTPSSTVGGSARYNMIERLNREIRRRTRVVGSFPDGRSALMLICARIRYVTRQPMERAPLPGHVPARRHHAINRLKSFPDDGPGQFAQNIGHNRISRSPFMTNEPEFHAQTLRRTSPRCVVCRNRPDDGWRAVRTGRNGRPVMDHLMHHLKG